MSQIKSKHVFPESSGMSYERWESLMENLDLTLSEREAGISVTSGMVYLSGRVCPSRHHAFAKDKISL